LANIFHPYNTGQRFGRRFRNPALLTIFTLAILGGLIIASQDLGATSSPIDGSLHLVGLRPSVVQAQSASEVYLPTVLKPKVSEFSVVFVSRQIPSEGSIYYRQGGTLPGVGSYSRFIVAAPGKLQVLEQDGRLRTLIDGSNPGPASLSLIDVNAPDVSYDGTKIVFAGLPNGQYESRPGRDSLGAWRIYTINVNGTGLRQVTFSDRDDLNLSQFSSVNHFEKYDDTDPAWLPDGRIVFSSTRWPSLAMYNDARTTNLYVVNANGSGLHRITAERNGADRALVDPLTGKIVYSRWWRNFRNPSNNMSTVTDLDGYHMNLGLVVENCGNQCGNGPNADLLRNAWQLATINPDGTGLAQFAGQSGIGGNQFSNQAYGGSFAEDGSIYTSFFPMHHLSEAGGFGGIRHFPRGAHGYSGVIGITDNNGRLVREDPPSFQVFRGDYAADPEVLPNGNLIISWATDTRQDYGLYTIKPDGSGLTLLYDNPGTSEIRGRLIRQRPLPPVIPDQVSKVASLLPPLAGGPYDIDGTFTYNALNVYFNGPVDLDIVNAIPVGSAGTIRSFIDQQRTSYGFPERLDWPILLQEIPVAPDGSIVTTLPANVPLFEQIRTPMPDYKVPLTGAGGSVYNTGAAHVAGLNFSPPGTVATCVGCHAGHTMIPIPENLEDAKWTNLAPSAEVTVSSLDKDISNDGRGLVDRRVKLGEGIDRYWLSQPSQSLTSEWIELTFPVPIKVRTVRLYRIPGTEGLSLDVPIQNATVQLYGPGSNGLYATNMLTSNASGSVSESGTDVDFDDVWATTVRIELDSTTGSVAGLAEVEVIAQAGTGP